MRIAGKVLVASDLEPGSDEAVRQAALIGGSGATVVVCHVLPEIFGIRPLFPHLRELDREKAEQVRRWVIARLEKQLRRGVGPDAPLPEIRIEAGSPHAVVLDVAKEIGAGLIAVGRTGSGAGTGERIARHAGCPVLIALPGAGKSVLAATDFSDPALPAVRAAQEEAERRDLPLVIVHAVDLLTSRLGLPEIVSPSTIARMIEERREGARQRLEELAKEVGANARVVLREGPAADEILAAAEEDEAELVVIGTHGRTGLGRFALGSVAEEVVRGAKRSTLIVPLES